MANMPDELLQHLMPTDEDLLARAPAHEEMHRTLDHWCSPVLMERAAYLRKMAKLGDGSASETIKEYERHAIMLSVRLRSGIAEYHEYFADLFIVLEGRATLVTGGTIVKPENVGLGEVRGASVEAGVSQELRAGDMAHVSAATPHQMLLTGDKGLVCIVINVREND